MLRTILVPLDGSDLAARAVPYASALAVSAGTKLVLMRALPRQVSGRLPDDRDETLAELTMDAAVLRAIGVSAETVVCCIQHFHASDIGEAISPLRRSSAPTSSSCRRTVGADSAAGFTAARPIASCAGHRPQSCSCRPTPIGPCRTLGRYACS